MCADQRWTQQAPTINEPNVKWSRTSGVVWCLYYVGGRGKGKQYKVKEDDVDDEFQAAVDIAARECQRFFEEHHVAPPEEDREGQLAVDNK